MADLTPAQSEFSARRYAHHHARWGAAERSGDDSRAARHLYALRAHLRHLGWLAPEHDVPGYGVRPVLPDQTFEIESTWQLPDDLAMELLDVTRLAHLYVLMGSDFEDELPEDFKPQKWAPFAAEFAQQTIDVYRRLLAEITRQTEERKAG